MTAHSTATAPRRRGRPRKTPSQFPGVVVPISSRPRLNVGDVAEMCRDCLPGNRGKLVIITGFDDEGFFSIRSISESLDAIDIKTGEITPRCGFLGRTKPENLYRRSRDLAKGVIA